MINIVGRDGIEGSVRKIELLSQSPATCQQRDVLAGGGKERRVITADNSGTIHQDPMLAARHK